MVTCAFVKYFGVECPGCGTQRAFIALLKGDLVSSVNYNASLIPFLITVLFTFAHLFIGFKNGSKTIVGMVVITVSIMLLQFITKLIFKH